MFLIQQLVRYGFVGAVSNIAIYFIYLLLTYWGMAPKVAMTVVFVAGASMGFVGNRRWTFSHRGDSTKAAHRFFIVYAVAYSLNFLAMWIAVDHMGLAHYLVQAVNVVVISILLFIAQKYWIFADYNRNKSNIETQ